MIKHIVALCLLYLYGLVASAQDCASLRQPNETYGAGEGKAISWCNMPHPTAYTDCMCKQGKANQVSAAGQQQLQDQALQKSTRASSLYQQAHHLATQAALEKDPSQLDRAKNLYQQAIALSKQAKGLIEQAYAGADPSYAHLKNLYLEQYNKQIEWATTGIEGIPNQKERIKAETHKKQIPPTPKKTNNWSQKKASPSKNTWQITSSGSKQNGNWASDSTDGMKKVSRIVNRQNVKNGDCDNSISLTYWEEGYMDASEQWVVEPVKSVSVTEMKAPPRLLLARSNCDYDCKKRMEKERNERYRRCNRNLKDKIASLKQNLKSQGYSIR